MTRSENTNTVWVESEPNKKDFKPMEAEYGEYVVWDGANCKHGNKKTKKDIQGLVLILDHDIRKLFKT